MRQIRELLPSLRHARLGNNVALDFRQEVEEVEEKANQAQLPEPADAVATDVPHKEVEHQREWLDLLIDAQSHVRALLNGPRHGGPTPMDKVLSQ